jgi:hypothetical protein
MISVRDYRNNSNSKRNGSVATAPKTIMEARCHEMAGESSLCDEPISFSEFKHLINGIDERRYGASLVYVGEDIQCPVIGFFTNPLPATGRDAAAGCFYSPAIHIHFVKSGRESAKGQTA